MSDIFGEGYGSCHDWKRGPSLPMKVTLYYCEACGAVFEHWYDMIPDIFKAIEDQGVPNFCVKAPEAQ